MPTLSIITINYNNKDGLRKTIESVVTQTESDFEYLIIDGASTDGSVDVIKEFAEHPVYGKKITYWVSEKDTGIYNAMNKGIKQATGYFCLFLNSGDYLSSIDVVYELNKVKKETVIYYSDEVYSNKNQIIGSQSYGENIDANFFILGCTLNHQNTLIPRNLLIENTLYDESYVLRADWLFFLKVSYKGLCNFKRIEGNISIYDRAGISSLQTDQNTVEMNRGMKEVFPTLHKSLLEYVDFKKSFYAKTVEIENSKFYRFYLRVYLFLLRRWKKICKK